MLISKMLGQIETEDDYREALKRFLEICSAPKNLDEEKELYLLAGGLISFGVIQFIAGALKAKNATSGGFYQVVNDVFTMPETMKQLAWVQFFSWFSLFAMWIYTTSAVTSFHYGSSDTSSLAYNNGADWVGVLFAAYNGFAAIAAMCIPVIVKKVGL